MTLDDLALAMLPHVGPRTAAQLIAAFGSAQNIFNTPVEQLVDKQVRPDVAQAIAHKSSHEAALNESRVCAKEGITLIAATDEFYPPLLRECGDHPHVLFFRGDLAALQKPLISMVGTRNVSGYGQKMCARLIEELSKKHANAVIVSGLAFGVDGECHRAALAVGMATVGVLAGPLTAITPAANAQLAEQMVRRGGGILSEYPSSTVATGRFYTPRNRIIAGLSAGTVVVESPYNGGSMITAGMADGYNRALMAVPGRVGDKNSEGTNFLIKAARARMVCSARDIALEVGWEQPDEGLARRFGGSRVGGGYGGLDAEYAAATGLGGASGIGSGSNGTGSGTGYGDLYRPYNRHLDTPGSTYGLYDPERDAVQTPEHMDGAPSRTPEHMDDTHAQTPEHMGGTPTRDTSMLSPDAVRLYELLPDAEAMGIEALAVAAGLSPGEMASALLELEFDGFIRVLPGKRYERD